MRAELRGSPREGFFISCHNLGGSFCLPGSRTPFQFRGLMGVLHSSRAHLHAWTPVTDFHSIREY